MMKLPILISILVVCNSLPFEENSNSKIVGGVNASKGQFPYIVSLRYTKDNKHFCGASIVNENWIALVSILSKN